ncbi:hypothetical protein [Providencia rettgeri]|jgi:hypothetical protein|uniref:hypothetical protein n=1 Tax=Providencia rettgeri TaxID=587 RepID=UPI002360AA80|nr:hypothetical protein [Providencia rettgeri]MDR2226096.1 hypothetical protein [Providencia sp.]
MANKYIGEVSFENYWGENIAAIYLEYHMADIFDSIESKRDDRGVVYNNIPDKTKIDNIMWFAYELDAPASYNYWFLHMRTESGKIYTSKGSFYCSITDADDEKVILGVNGESENLYVHYSASSGCSTKMKRNL